MKMSSLRYILPEPFISIKRNPLMSLTAIATVAITLFLCGMFYLLVLNVNENAAQMESAVEVKVFVAADATPEETKALADTLKKISGVASVRFVSKDDGLASMSSRFGDANRITAAIDTNPLPDSYTLKADKPEAVTAIAAAAEKVEKVEAVRYGQGTVENLFQMLNWIRTIGLGVMVLMGISAVVLIGMNIRLTVTARKEEIQVMKYVGASNSFISWPFILEGVILALLGAIVAIAALIFAYSKFFTYLTLNLAFVAMLDLSAVILPLVLGMLLIGFVLGALGSIFAVRKFLRV